MEPELITIRQIEEQYGISPTKLKTIRSVRNGFNFPAPVENENPRDQVKKYLAHEVEQFFKANNIEKISCYASKGNGSTIANLLAFYRRNFPAKQHGGGETVTVKIRPNIDDHWDNEHQRGGFDHSSGITIMYIEGI